MINKPPTLISKSRKLVSGWFGDGNTYHIRNITTGTTTQNHGNTKSHRRLQPTSWLSKGRPCPSCPLFAPCFHVIPLFPDHTNKPSLRTHNHAPARTRSSYAASFPIACKFVQSVRGLLRRWDTVSGRCNPHNRRQHAHTHGSAGRYAPALRSPGGQRRSPTPRPGHAQRASLFAFPSSATLCRHPRRLHQPALAPHTFTQAASLPH